MNEKEIAKIYDYERVDCSQEVMVQTPDGLQKQVIPHFTTVLKCPTCQAVFFDFQQDIPDAYVRRVVNAHKSAFEPMGYCTCCGQKLRYDYDFIDVESEVVEAE